MRCHFIAALLWSSLGLWAAGPPERSPRNCVLEVEVARAGPWLRPADHVDLLVGEVTLRDVLVVSTGKIAGTCNICFVPAPLTYPVMLQVTREEAELVRFAQRADVPIIPSLR